MNLSERVKAVEAEITAAMASDAEAVEVFRVTMLGRNGKVTALLDELKSVPAEEKRATWEAYQALSPEEKRKLAAGAPSRPPGAAPALKPVPATKLATTPNANPPRGGASGTSPAAARAASAPRQIDQKTLLPRKVASAP